MITLYMDTAFKRLNLLLARDQKPLAGISVEAFKKQSELIFVELNELLAQAGLTYKDLNRIVITRGPGSYTGVRIAMSIAKVLASQLHIPLYTISTMQLFTGKKSGKVLLDARAKRAFYAEIEEGKIRRLEILPLEEIESLLSDDDLLFGDAGLVDREAQPSDFLENFLLLEEELEPVENVHLLKPEYLKEYMGHA